MKIEFSQSLCSYSDKGTATHTSSHILSRVCSKYQRNDSHYMRNTQTRARAYVAVQSTRVCCGNVSAFHAKQTKPVYALIHTGAVCLHRCMRCTAHTTIAFHRFDETSIHFFLFVRFRFIIYYYCIIIRNEQKSMHIRCV